MLRRRQDQNKDIRTLFLRATNSDLVRPIYWIAKLSGNA
jgi:hypothetical protein